MKNKIIRVIKHDEHILYEVSAEILTVLEDDPLMGDAFHNVQEFSDRIVQSLSHTRSEAERTRVALDLMKDIWEARIDFAPYLPPNLLATFEYDRLFYPRYRDHTVHQLRVFLLGLYLYVRNKRLRDAMLVELMAINPGSSRAQLDHLFVSLWLVTAVYHDQGYVFELARDDDGVHLANSPWCKSVRDPSPKRE